MEIELRGEKVTLEFMRYMPPNGNPAIVTDKREKLSINPELKLEDGLICIVDHDWHEGNIKALVDAGIVSEPVAYIKSGFVKLWVCKILKPELWK